MAENSVKRPLLLSGDVEADPYTRNPSLFVLWAKRVLKTLMWVVFFAWIAVMFLYPGEFGSNVVQKWERVSEGTPFGVTGTKFSQYCFLEGSLSSGSRFLIVLTNF